MISDEVSFLIIVICVVEIDKCCLKAGSHRAINSYNLYQATKSHRSGVGAGPVGTTMAGPKFCRFH